MTVKLREPCDDPGALRIQRPSGENNPVAFEKQKRVWLQCGEPRRMSGLRWLSFSVECWLLSTGLSSAVSAVPTVLSRLPSTQ